MMPKSSPDDEPTQVSCKCSKSDVWARRLRPILLKQLHGAGRQATPSAWVVFCRGCGHAGGHCPTKEEAERAFEAARDAGWR